MNYDIQEFKSKFEDSLENIKNCYKAYKDIVYGLKQIDIEIENIRSARPLDLEYYLFKYDYSKKISDLVDDACEIITPDSKYISYEKLLSIINGAINQAKEIAKEDFVNELPIINEASSKLKNFYTLLEVFNNSNSITFRNLIDLSDTELSFLRSSDLNDYEDFLSNSVLNYINSFNSKLEDFAYVNPLLSKLDLLIDLTTDTTLESAHDTMEFELIDKVEKYGENALNNTNFLSGYFSSDKEVREIYRSSLKQVNEMQNKYNEKENEETQHKVKRK